MTFLITEARMANYFKTSLFTQGLCFGLKGVSSLELTSRLWVDTGMDKMATLFQIHGHLNVFLTTWERVCDFKKIFFTPKPDDTIVYHAKVLKFASHCVFALTTGMKVVQLWSQFVGAPGLPRVYLISRVMRAVSASLIAQCDLYLFTESSDFEKTPLKDKACKVSLEALSLMSYGRVLYYSLVCLFENRDFLKNMEPSKLADGNIYNYTMEEEGIGAGKWALGMGVGRWALATLQLFHNTYFGLAKG